MRTYYFEQSRLLFLLFAIAIGLSVAFNVWLLHDRIYDQVILVLFFITTVYMEGSGNRSELLHKIVSVLVLAGAVLSMFYERDFWVIK